MNKTYKVARSLSRGVVVTSEKASSRQGKVLKTVAAAVLSALVAGTAMAAEWPYVDAEITISNTNFTIQGSTKQTHLADNPNNVTYACGAEKCAWQNGTNILVDGTQIRLNNGTVIFNNNVDDQAQGQNAKHAILGSGTIQVVSKAYLDANSESLGKDGDIVVQFVADNESSAAGGRQGIIGGSETQTYDFTLGAKGNGQDQAVHKVELNVGKNADAYINVRGGALILENVVIKNDGGYLELAAQTTNDKEILVQSDIGQEASGGQTVFGSKTRINGANVTADKIVLAQSGATKDDLKAYSKVFSFDPPVSGHGTNDRNVTVENGGLLEATTQLDIASGRTLTINPANYPQQGNKAGQLKVNTLNVSGTVQMQGTADIQVVNAKSGSRVSLTGHSTIGKAVVENAGTLTLGGNVELKELSVTGTSSGNGTVNLAAGTIRTSSDQLFKPVTDKNGIEAIGGLKDGVSNTSGAFLTLRLTDAAFNYTVAQLQAVANGTSGAHVQFENGLLIAGDGKETFANGASIGYTGKSALIEATSSSAVEKALSLPMTFGSLEIKDSSSGASTKFTGLTFNAASGSSGMLTLRGDADGKVFYLPKAVDASGAEAVMPVVLNVDTVFGDEAAAVTDKAVVDGRVTANKSVKIAKNGDFTFAEDLTLGGADASGDLTVEGRFAGKNIIASASGAGTRISGGVVVLDGTTPQAGAVKAQVSTGKAVIGSRQLESGEVQGGLLVLGSASEADAAAYQKAHSRDNTLWIGQAVTLKDQVFFGAAMTNKNNLSGVNTAVIDLAQVARSGYQASAQNAVVNSDAGLTRPTANKLVLANLRNIAAGSRVYDEAKSLYYLNTGVDVAAAGTNPGTVDFGTTLYLDDSAVADGKVYFRKNNLKLDQLKALGLNSVGEIEHALDTVNFESAVAGFFVFDVFGDNPQNAEMKAAKEGWAKYQAENGAGWTEEDRAREEKAFFAPLFNKIAAAEHAATNMAAYGGSFSSAFDYQNEVTDALNRRYSAAGLNAPRAEGFTPWVDVFGSRNKAKTLFGSSEGYEADLYGSVLGFDYAFSGGGLVGAALNVGKADGNSVGGSGRVDNNADYYGISLYAAHPLGVFNFKGDLGYIHASNDLSTSSLIGSFKESLDGNLWTAGVGAEVPFSAGPVDLAPHAGVRMTRLSMDDSKYGADYDAMTIYQLPVGISASSTFEAEGWKFAPKADVTLVLTAGDKEASANYFGGITDTTRVLDSNPVQGTIGLEAGKGAFTFGLNYRLTTGGDDRTNKAFNANVRYAF